MAQGSCACRLLGLDVSEPSIFPLYVRDRAKVLNYRSVCSLNAVSSAAMSRKFLEGKHIHPFIHSFGCRRIQWRSGIKT